MYIYLRLSSIDVQFTLKNQDTGARHYISNIPQDKWGKQIVSVMLFSFNCGINIDIMSS